MLFLDNENASVVKLAVEVRRGGEKKNTPLLGVATRVKRLLLRLARPLKNVWPAFPPHVCALLPLSLCTRYVTCFCRVYISYILHFHA